VLLNAVDPRDSSLEYKWFSVGMLDYDEVNKLYLVQKVNKNGRVVTPSGHSVVNGGIRDDGWNIVLLNLLLVTSLVRRFLRR
jgi:hypothetical protein